MSQMDMRIQRTIEGLRSADVSRLKGIIGFDGFVDEIVHVVDKRYDAERYKRIETIGAYGERISRAAGLSTNIEVVPVARKIGGNGPIFANALLNHDMRFTYIGALGRPEIHPIFSDFTARCEAVSISEPGYTDAVEFFDGKIIRSKLEGLKDVSWAGLTRVLPVEALRERFAEADYFAFLNWSLTVNVTGLWRGLLEEVLPEIGHRPGRMLFIDLADPEKREAEDLREAIELIERMGEYAEVSLGLNKKEACEIAALYGVRYPDSRSVEEAELLDALRERLDVAVLLVHSVKSASAGRQIGPIHTVSGLYCASPRLTTGAGDNFNAGYMFGRACGLDIAEALCAAVYNSGYYVRNAHSPNTRELIHFMEEKTDG